MKPQILHEAYQTFEQVKIKELAGLNILMVLHNTPGNGGNILRLKQAKIIVNE